MILFASLALALQQQNPPTDQASPPSVAPASAPSTSADENLDPNAIIRDPVWLQRASQTEIAEVLPEAAAIRGFGGMGAIVCNIGIDTRVTGCYSTDPLNGFGFGAAVARLAPEFRIQPKTVNGVPIEGKIVIPIRFEPQLGGKTPPLPWTRAPTATEVAAATPRIRGTGTGTMRCTVSTGGLAGCRPVGDPRDPLGRAAVTLAPKFTLGPIVDGFSTEGIILDVPVSFDGVGQRPTSAAAPSIRVLSQPTNAQKNAVFPAAARSKGITRLTVIESCVVAVDGSLNGCRATQEKPVGVGGAEAAIRLVNAFQIATWTPEGRPVAGAPVTITVDWDDPQGAPQRPTPPTNPRAGHR